MPETPLRKLIARRFIQRTDVKAQQDSNGYHPLKAKWAPEDIDRHLKGERSYGHYLLDTNNKCKLFAYDLDVVKEKREVFEAGGEEAALLTSQLNLIAEGLARRAHKLTECHVAAAFSGNKGVHVYCFTGPEPAADVREAALEVINSFGAFEPIRGDNFFRQKYGDYQGVEIEVFPKQTEIGPDGFGNLMRLPLGVNKKSGVNGHFIQFIPPTTEFTEMEPTAALGDELPWG